MAYLHIILDTCIAQDRVFYEIYRHEHEGELPCILLKHEDFSLLQMNTVQYRTVTVTTVHVHTQSGHRVSDRMEFLDGGDWGGI